jgi:FtsP/CotA-like multicopper oxidase with cupredoxin domain
MKNCFFLSVLLLFSFSVVTAQHEGHQMPAKEQNRSQQRSVRRIGPVVEYHLYVKDTTVNYTGRRRKALAINGQIPAPTLRFTEGDSAVIYVHNLLREEVSIHWHGVLLPNEEDGVHLLNTPPIHAGKTHVFRFRIIQNGTLWYHSHSRTQEQEGLYGPLVFYPAAQGPQRGPMEEVLLLSDWRDERGRSIMRSLKRRNEWYAIKKGAVQSWGEALVKGHFGDKVQMEWTRMPGADVSDVYYDRHLMHGQPVRTFGKYKKGDSVRLRVINGSAASYYWLQYSGGKMKVVATDGNDVTPVAVDKILIATAETYDILIHIPENGQYEFRATAQDITGSASAFFGSGAQVKAKDIPKLDYMVLMNEMNRMTWAMKGMGMDMKMGLYMKMDMEGMNMSGMQHGGTSRPGMDHGTAPTDSLHSLPAGKGDTAGTQMHREGMDHVIVDRSDTATKAKDTLGRKATDHSGMPGMQKPPPAKGAVTTKKPATTTVKKKAVVRKPTTKKPAPKKVVPKKPAPKKKDPMEGMDHSKHGGRSVSEPKRPLFDPELVAGLLAADTVPSTKKERPAMDHSGHQIGTAKGDTVPKKNMPSVQHGQHEGTNKAGMQGGMPSSHNAEDTTRSYMLQTMMPKMPMTGFDFPPGNGSDVVLGYDMLRSDTLTVLPTGRPWREIELTLSGNMQRFVWSINGKTLAQQDTKIMIRKGENVRVVFTNATMMEHPIHLHGHFFRVINNQTGHAPMKHTFNVNAMATQVIEFAATEEKDWFLHCHTLYHMLSGMATIFSYAGTESEVQKAHPGGLTRFRKDHGAQYYPWANIALHSQGTFGTAVYSGAKAQLSAEWKWDWKRSYEVEPRLQYFLDKRQYFSAFVGSDLQHLDDVVDKVPVHLEKKHVATAGLIYTLPFFINADRGGCARGLKPRAEGASRCRKAARAGAPTRRWVGYPARAQTGKLAAAHALYLYAWGLTPGPA